MRKAEHIRNEKQPFKTNFGPEEGDDEKAVIRGRAALAVREQREHLMD